MKPLYTFKLIEHTGIAYPSGELLAFSYEICTGDLDKDYRTTYNTACQFWQKKITCNVFMINGNDVYWMNDPDYAKQLEGFNAARQLLQEMQRQSQLMASFLK